MDELLSVDWLRAERTIKAELNRAVDDAVRRVLWPEWPDETVIIDDLIR